MLLICQLTIISSFANTITVTNTNDNGTGSLRQAIVDAVAGDTINFAVTDTITLTTGELLINKRLTIIGPGASVLAIDGNSSTRIFQVIVPTTISGLTIQNGNTSVGAGVNATDTLTLHHCVITQNYAAGAAGISSAISLTIRNCEISHNYSASEGGGMQTSMQLIMDSCLVTENYAQYSGGGINCINSGGITIKNTTVSHCTAETSYGPFLGGGGIYFSSCLNVKITNCLITENKATYADGGGVYNCNYGDLTMRNCTISKNRAGAHGGGYGAFTEGNLRIYTSSIFGNRAGPEGGGMRFQNSALFEMDSCLIYNDTASRAGGIAVIGSACLIKNSSIYKNHARIFYGGALVLSVPGYVTLMNNTISGNTAITDGGAIWYQGALSLINNTITDNIANQYADGIFQNLGAIGVPDQYMNNIFSNPRNYDCITNCVAPVSLGGNISSDSSMINYLTDATDFNYTNPLLDTLAFNGGPTPTHALLCSSPAINAGIFNNLFLDQRGMPRIGNHDIGAFESGTHTNATLAACDSYTWTANGNTTYTSSGIYTATLTSSAGCDSVVTLNLTINTGPVLTTSVSGMTITADETGASYQWIDCSTNSIINGATGQSYTATANGNYAVVVTNNNCSDTSACVNITALGISPNPGLNAHATIYPNPGTGNFTLITELTGKNYRVTDNIGKVVAQGIIKQKQTAIDLSNSPAGVYYINIEGQYFKLVMQ